MLTVQLQSPLTAASAAEKDIMENEQIETTYEPSHEDRDHEHHHHREVDIIIDRDHLKTPSETTGAALYVLGKVQSGWTLYWETPGPREDEPIPNDQTIIHVHEHAKFYSTPGKVTPGGCCE
jgi:hypothetical protein